jgi:hypothetical protein
MGDSSRLEPGGFSPRESATHVSLYFLCKDYKRNKSETQEPTNTSPRRSAWRTCQSSQRPVRSSSSQNLRVWSASGPSEAVADRNRRTQRTTNGADFSRTSFDVRRNSPSSWRGTSRLRMPPMAARAMPASRRPVVAVHLCNCGHGRTFEGTGSTKPVNSSSRSCLFRPVCQQLARAPIAGSDVVSPPAPIRANDGRRAAQLPHAESLAAVSAEAYSPRHWYETAICGGCPLGVTEWFGSIPIRDGG